MKKLILISFLFFTPLYIFSQGLIFSSSEDLSQISEIPTDYGFATDLPSNYSLEKYVPYVKKQEGGTCVGFSTFYYALSTMYNIEFNITKNMDKFAHSFDPYFIYSVVYNNRDDCDRGLNFPDAFNSLYKIGTKKLLFPPFTSCDEDWTEEKLANTIAYTDAYSINEYYIIDVKKPDFIENVKQAIAFEMPVVIGLETTKSMDPYSSSNTSGIGSSGLWTPTPNEKGDGGHALCVIGYDDQMYGGSFRIVNSWGNKFGDNGYMWITYSDFKNYTKESYIMELNENVKSRPLFKDGLVDDDYKRYGYKTKNNKVNTYEGQYLNNSNTGYGIWLDEENNTHYVGKFNNGSMNGLFFILDEDGVFSGFGKNGVFEDITKLGFGEEGEEIMQQQLSVYKYFDKFGVEVNGIRKSNSTSSNSVKQSGNE
jgi:C1A family cysteine protease